MVADAVAFSKVLFDRLDFRNLKMPIIDDDFANIAGVVVRACPERHGEIAAAELLHHRHVVALSCVASAAAS